MSFEPAWGHCMTYRCGCRCPDCLKREQAIAKYGFTEEGKIAYPKPKPQPWEQEHKAA